MESFVLGELARQITWTEVPVRFYHYRDRDDYEVDAVLEHVSGEIVAIEVKAAQTERAEDLRGIRRWARRLGEQLVAGGRLAAMSGGARDDVLLDLVRRGDLGVLATLKRDGRPQLSNVNYAWSEVLGGLRVSVTDGRAKTANLRRDPRASLHVAGRDGWSYAVVEGVAELTPVASDPADATVDELVEVYRDIRGEHPDWAEYRSAMVADRRLVLRLAVERVYGLVQPT